jgi:hypothetical protein
MVRVGVLSQNLAEVKTQPNIDDNTVIALNPDLYIEMTQEDGRTPDGTPVINKSTLFSKYRLLDYVSLNGKQQTKQNIALNIYLRNDTSTGAYSTLNKGTDIIAPKGSSLRLFAQEVAKTLHTGYGYSKGMVYAKIKTPKRPILFVNMHLPMDGKDLATLGLKFRKVSFFNLLVKLKSTGLLDDRPFIFVGGDLNFRMDFSGHNQLNAIMQSTNHEETKLLYGLKELKGLSGTMGITCKFKTQDYNCRSRKLPKNANNIPKFLETIQADCGDESRTPSRCDRFLVSKDIAPITVLLNTSKYLPIESDHNAIMCCFEFLERTPSPSPIKTKGGRTYKINKINKINSKTRNARIRAKSQVTSR